MNLQDIMLGKRKGKMPSWDSSEWFDLEEQSQRPSSSRGSAGPVETPVPGDVPVGCTISRTALKPLGQLLKGTIPFGNLLLGSGVTDTQQRAGLVLMLSPVMTSNPALSLSIIWES